MNTDIEEGTQKLGENQQIVVFVCLMHTLLVEKPFLIYRQVVDTNGFYKPGVAAHFALNNP